MKRAEYMTPGDYLRTALSDGIPLRSLKVALVVGPVLTLINQPAAVTDPAQFSFAKFLLTLVVPYLVATIGAVGAEAGSRHDTHPPASEAARGGPGDQWIREYAALAHRVDETARGVNKASRERAEALTRFVEEARAAHEDTLDLERAAGDSASHLETALASSRDVQNTVETTREDMRDGLTLTRETQEAIAGFNQRFSDIQGMAEQIRAIARQTNLLALNARVEAARAGEAGKGFAVVAERVNELAGDAGQAAERIHETLDGMGSAAAALDTKIARLTETMTGLERTSGQIDTAVDTIAATLAEAGEVAASTADHAQRQTRQTDSTLKRLEQLKRDTEDAIEGSANNMQVGKRLVELAGTLPAATAEPPAPNALTDT
ncbi:hypothetical protein H0Z60_21005 [Ectothiorhodospiraceae bacterium WFHF3C12]|nr:hypothetical protein [Ectothiorhodospiraceae bacterium WFHF3C12]